MFLALPLSPLIATTKLASDAARSGLVRLALMVCLGCLLQVVPAAAITKTSHSSAKSGKHSTFRVSRHFRLPKSSPLFPGLHESPVAQNAELDRSQLPRIANEYELSRYEMSSDLVPVSETDALKISEFLAENRRYCRPWTRDFLQDLSQAFYEQFHAPLQVNSLVRTADQQRILRRHNRYAAPESGEAASTHLAGVTVDLSSRGLSTTQYKWIRGYMLPLQTAGMIDPIQERQPVLHVVVFEKYSELHPKEEPSPASEASEPTESGESTGSGSQP